MIRATQVTTRSVNLTAPRVTFMNGAGGSVSITTTQNIIGGSSAVSGASATNTQTGVAPPSGVAFAVNGTVTQDRRYVILELNGLTLQSVVITTVNIQQPNPQIQIPGTTGTTGLTGITGLTGTTASSSNSPIITNPVELPTTTTSNVNTTVMVPDKGTLLLGGQRLVQDTEIEAGVPVLDKIPILQRLFTNRSSVKSERTLLMLVKPTIIIANEQEDDLFPGLLQDPAKYNIRNNETR